MKKIISVILSLLIILSACAVPVSAESIFPTADEKAEFEQNAYDTIDVFVYIMKAVHEIVGSILSFFGKNCPFCGVLHGSEEENGNCCIAINDSAFLFDEDTAKYYIFEKVEKITGSVTDYKNVESITFTVSDIFGNVVDSGSIIVAENWSAENIGFLIGENILIVSAKYKDGIVVRDEIRVDCHIDVYMNELDIDTQKDSDGDLLADYLEINYCKTDINRDDSDNDGLSDYYEAVVLRSNPLETDSDCDGICDADEDYDNDGLSNIYETENGLDPSFNDSDFDNLHDGEEINLYGTDPLNKDTDSDSVSDADEVAIGSNPLVAESSFTAKASTGAVSENNPVALEVQTELLPEQVGTLKITPVTSADNSYFTPSIPGYLGAGFDITVDGNVSKATLKFRYDASLGEPDAFFQPRIYYFNEEEKTFEELPDQTVEDGIVTAETPHFSKYILLNKTEFDKVWNEDIVSPSNNIGSHYLGIDAAYVFGIDDPLLGSIISLIKVILFQHIFDVLDEDDRVALIRSGEYATRVCDLTTDKEQILEHSFMSNGSPAMYTGLEEALDMFENTADNQHRHKMIFLISDGKDEPSVDYNSVYAPLIERAIENNIVVHTLGLPGNTDVSLLEKIAENTGGMSSYLGALDDEQYLFVLIGSILLAKANIIDSNNDGLSDYYTQLLYEGKMPLSNGSLEFTGIDLNYGPDGSLCDDFDGDGLKNGQELIIKETSNGVCAVMNSDPLMDYSDSDVYPDYYEYTIGSDPMIPSYSAPHIDYVLDDTNFTYKYVFDNEDSSFDSFARNMWSTITFNWSHEDEALRLIAGFANEYADVESIEDLSNIVMKDLAEQYGSQAISGLKSFMDNGVGTVTQIADTVIGVKQWISAGRRTNIKSDWFTTLNARLGQFKYFGTTKFYTKVGAIGKYATSGISIINEALDLFDICSAYSKLSATSDAFMKMEEMLIFIRDNDNQKEKYVGKAAAEALAIISDEYNSFMTGGLWEEITDATIENGAQLVVSVLSGINPFIAAVNLMTFALDTFLPLTEIGEGVYSLYVVDEIANACKALFDYTSISEMCYDVENTEIKYLEWLIFARMQGGNFAEQITSKQHYWGLFNDDEIRQQYRNAIASENSRLNECFTQIRNSIKK